MTVRPETGSVPVTIGPVSSRSVLAWVDVSRRFLMVVDQSREKLPFHLPVDALHQMYDYFDEWERLARRSETFLWSVNEDPVRVHALLNYGYNLAIVADELRERLPIPDAVPEGQPFEEAMLRGFTDALAAHDDADFARRIVEQWPVRDD